MIPSREIGQNVQPPPKATTQDPVIVDPIVGNPRPRHKCHIRQFKVNPDVDPKIHIQIPEEALNAAKIRVIAPPPCHRD